MKVGDIFNWWEVIEINGRKITCKCKCGSIKVINKYDLVNNKSTKCVSCASRISHTKHNKVNTRMYSIWCDIKKRCYNPKYRQYKDYGGRGISMCAEWIHCFENFYQWAAANGYKDSLTIDRIDVNKGYCPSNCRWTTMSVQALNKRCRNKFGHPGIYLLPNGKYRATLKHGSKNHSLGCFSNVLDAIEARKKEEVSIYGFCL